MRLLRSFSLFALLLILGLSLIRCESNRAEEKKPAQQTNVNKADSIDWVDYIQNAVLPLQTFQEIPLEKRSTGVLIALIQESGVHPSPFASSALDSSMVWNTPGANQQVADTLVKHFPPSLKYVPKQYVNPEMERVIISKGSNQIRNALRAGYEFADENWSEVARKVQFPHIPGRFLTREMLKESINRGDIVKKLGGGFAPGECSFAGYCNTMDSLWTPSLARQAFQRDWRVYSKLPVKYREYWMAKGLLEKDGTFLQYVPRDQKFINNGELCQIALRQTDKARGYVPAYFEFDFQFRQ